MDQRTFLEDFKNTLDIFGMPMHTGNPMLELGTAAGLSGLLQDDIQENEVNRICIEGYLRLLIRNGLIAKKLNANGTLNSDEVTFDDMRGVLALGPIFSKHVMYECQASSRFGFWIYSNTGKVYWSAIVKPWDKYYIELLSNGNVNFFKLLFLSIYIRVQGLTPSDSGDRMTWLMCITLIRYRKGLLGNLMLNSIKYFLDKLIKRGGINGVFKRYHGPISSTHPYIVYSEGL